MPDDWRERAIREGEALAHKHNMRDLRRIILFAVVAFGIGALILWGVR